MPGRLGGSSEHGWVLNGEPVAPSGAPVDTLCEALRTDFRALAFWDRRCADIAVLKDKLDCPLHSACLEVCPKTWAAEGTVRLHLHVALQRSSKAICVDSVAELAIDDAVPHISAARGGNLSRLKKNHRWLSALLLPVPEIRPALHGLHAPGLHRFPCQSRVDH